MQARKLRLICSPTPHWDEMRRFYAEVLGLPESGGWDLPGDRGAFLSLPTGEIEVMEQDVVALGIMEGNPSGWHVALEVEDAAAERERLLGARVSLLRDLVERPWGTRDFLIADPAGRPILVYEEPSH